MVKAIDVEQVKDEIRKLNPSDKTEICRWIDHEAAVDLLLRIGVARKSNRSAERRAKMISKIETDRRDTGTLNPQT